MCFSNRRCLPGLSPSPPAIEPQFYELKYCIIKVVLSTRPTSIGLLRAYRPRKSVALWPALCRLGLTRVKSAK